MEAVERHTEYEEQLRGLVKDALAADRGALYRFAIAQDEVRLLALRHQRELGFLP